MRRDAGGGGGGAWPRVYYNNIHVHDCTLYIIRCTYSGIIIMVIIIIIIIIILIIIIIIIIIL